MTLSGISGGYRVALILAALAVPSTHAVAQDALPAPEAPRLSDPDAADSGEVPAAVGEDLSYARYLNDVGIGLTIGGLTTAGAGTGAIFAGPAGGIAGGTFAGIGGVLALAGIPIWIAGSVRANILASSPSDRSRVAWSYELAGMVTTLTSFGICVVGIGLIIGGIAVAVGFHGSGAETTHEILIGTGGALIPIGAFVGLFIGAPLWAEGARF